MAPPLAQHVISVGSPGAFARRGAQFAVAPGRAARYNQRVTPKEPLPVKRDVGRALLLKGSVFVHLDPRVQGVVVPEWLRDQPQLVLQVGLDMPVPIPDLRVDGNGVFGTLSFKGSPFTCAVPWDAVYALVGDDGRGMVWPESMPPEIASEVEREVRRKALDPTQGEGKPEGSEARPSWPAAVPALALDDVDDVDDAAHADDGEAGDGLQPRRLRQPLQVVRDDEGSDDDGTDGGRGGRRSGASTKRGASKKKALPPYIRVVK